MGTGERSSADLGIQSKNGNYVKNKTVIFLHAGIFSVAGFLALLLMYQNYFFNEQAQYLLDVQEEYREYIDIMKNFLDSSTSDDRVCSHGADCDGFEPTDLTESFIVLNRDSEYLKQSMIDYIKDQQLDDLLTRVDAYGCQDASEVITAAKKSTPQLRKRTKRPIKKSAQKTVDHYPQPPDIYLSWPVERSNFWLSSRFGPRKRKGKWKFHYGVDMAAVKGTPVRAAATGKVVEAHYAPGYGNTIVVLHSNKYKTRYAHLNKIHVKKGQAVEQGAHIGDVGATGFTISKGGDASHLHFELYKNGKQINPLQMLPRL